MWQLGDHQRFPVSADRQRWAWVGFDVPSDACLHADFSSLVPVTKRRA